MKPSGSSRGQFEGHSLKDIHYPAMGDWAVTESRGGDDIDNEHFE